MIDKSTIQQARQTSLAAYLLSIGEPLVRSGSRHKHKEHNSLTFTKGAYFWNSRNEHGNAVDYLTRHMGMDFETAVTALASFVPVAEKENAGQGKKIEGQGMASDLRRTFAYLNKTRGIDGRLINTLIELGHLKEENETHNAVFVIFDEHGERVGAELEGTLSNRRFKGVERNSKSGYGFNVRYSKNAGKEIVAPKYSLFFESAVDLLSFIDLKTNHHGKNLADCLLVSMAGLKINILERMRNVFGGEVVLCIDNDTAADGFIAAVTAEGIPHRIHRPDPPHKDWNEQLNFLSK